MSKGLLISFEGIDRVGKSTQVNYLIKHLKSKEIDYLLVREPGSTEIGERIRDILADPALKGKISPLCEFLLYSSSRAQLVLENITPALNDGKIVIADRYYDSSTAYQGYGRGLDPDFISNVNTAVTGGLVPDLTILLFVEKFTASSTKGHDRFAPTLFDDRLEQEFMGFRKKVQDGFLQIAEREKERFLVIEASDKKDQIAKKIALKVDSLIRSVKK